MDLRQARPPKFANAALRFPTRGAITIPEWLGAACASDRTALSAPGPNLTAALTNHFLVVLCLEALHGLHHLLDDRDLLFGFPLVLGGRLEKAGYPPRPSRRDITSHSSQVRIKRAKLRRHVTTDQSRHRNLKVDSMKARS
jgi:hypothetical protein